MSRPGDKKNSLEMYTWQIYAFALTYLLFSSNYIFLLPQMPRCVVLTWMYLLKDIHGTYFISRKRMEYKIRQFKAHVLKTRKWYFQKICEKGRLGNKRICNTQTKFMFFCSFCVQINAFSWATLYKLPRSESHYKNPSSRHNINKEMTIQLWRNIIHYL